MFANNPIYRRSTTPGHMVAVRERLARWADPAGRECLARLEVDVDVDRDVRSRRGRGRGREHGQQRRGNE